MPAFSFVIRIAPAPLDALTDIRTSLGGLLPETILTLGLVLTLVLPLVRRIPAWLTSTVALLTLAAAAVALAVREEV